MGGFELTNHKSAGSDDTTGPRRSQGINFFNKTDLLQYIPNSDWSQTKFAYLLKKLPNVLSIKNV
jgi:hypothetical protein